MTAASLAYWRSVADWLFKPGIILAGELSYTRKTLISVLLFNLSLGAVAFFYMELQSAQIARLKQEVSILASSRPKVEFVNRLVVGRFYEVLAGPRNGHDGVRAESAPAEFSALFLSRDAKPIPRVMVAFRQLASRDSEGLGQSIAQFAGYTGLLRIAISELEDDLRNAGVLGDPAHGALGDVIARQFPQLIDNAAKQILVPKLRTDELAPYASGAQLIVDDSTDRIRTALRSISLHDSEKAGFLNLFEKSSSFFESLAEKSASQVNFDNPDDPAVLAMCSVEELSGLWATLVSDLEHTIERDLQTELERRKMVQLALVLLMLVLGYMAVATSLAIQAGIRQLSEGSNAFCAGNLKSRVSVTSRDEFAILAMNFNQVAEQCNSLLNELSERSAREQYHLELIVKERTEELEDSNHSLRETLVSLKKMQTELIQSEKMAALGGLVAGVAHEVNTPLGLAYTMVTHLDDQLRGLERRYKDGVLSAEDMEGFLVTALESSAYASRNLERATALIRSFKQVAVDRSNDQQRVFELVGYLDEIVHSLHALIRKAGHVVNIEVAEPIRLNSFPGALGQIITNLLVNAVVHGFEGRTGGTVTIRAEKASGGGCILTVTDNGSGIAPEILPKIFEPFFTTKRGAAGSGLGLSIVFNLVTQQLGGSIRCESAPDEGARFIIFIPEVVPPIVPLSSG